MINVLLIATYDSFLKAGLSVAHNIENADIDVYIHKVCKQQLSKKQIHDAGLQANKIQYFYISDIFKIPDFLEKYQIIILSAGNGVCYRFFKEYHQHFLNKAQRPIVIGVFPGVIFGDTASINARLNSDILLCYSTNDTQIATQLAALNNNHVDIINYGLPSERLSVNTQAVDNIYFIDQVRIPYRYEEREYVINQLIKLAQKYPDRTVYIKTRIAKNEKTVHQDKFSYQSILHKHNPLPSNLKIIHEDIRDSIRKMDICLSFSSTVSFEAIQHNIPSFVISDFGIAKEYENITFLGSDILINFNQFIENIDNLPQINQVWKESNLHITNEKYQLNKSINLALSNIVPYKPEDILCGRAFYCKSTLSFKSRFIRKTKKFFRNPSQFFIDSKLFEK